MGYRHEYGALGLILIIAIFTISWYVASFAHGYLPKGRTLMDEEKGGNNEVFTKISFFRIMNDYHFLSKPRKNKIFCQGSSPVEQEFILKK